MGHYCPCMFSTKSASRPPAWTLAWNPGIPSAAAEDKPSACSVMPLQEGGYCLNWQLSPVLIPCYSGKGTEKGELQGQFSISIDHRLCGELMEARQVTSSRALLHPRGCFRNRQLKSFNLGKFPACHPYHSPRHAGVNAGGGHPGWQPPVSAHPGGKSSSSCTASTLLPCSAGTLWGAQAELAFSDLLC